MTLVRPVADERQLQQVETVRTQRTPSPTLPARPRRVLPYAVFFRAFVSFFATLPTPPQLEWEQLRSEFRVGMNKVRSRVLTIASGVGMQGGVSRGACLLAETKQASRRARFSRTLCVSDGQLGLVRACCRLQEGRAVLCQRARFGRACPSLLLRHQRRWSSNHLLGMAWRAGPTVPGGFGACPQHGSD